MKYINLIAVLLLVSNVADASEGMMYGFAYDCNAERINNVLASECTKNHPELSTSIEEALSSWKTRNKNRIENCQDELLNIEPKEKRKKMTLEIEKLTEEIVIYVTKSAMNKDSEYCKEAIAQINDSKWDIIDK